MMYDETSENESAALPTALLRLGYSTLFYFITLVVVVVVVAAATVLRRPDFGPCCPETGMSVYW